MPNVQDLNDLIMDAVHNSVRRDHKFACSLDLALPARRRKSNELFNSAANSRCYLRRRARIIVLNKLYRRFEFGI
jgi:hypothetical protein